MVRALRRPRAAPWTKPSEAEVERRLALPRVIIEAAGAPRSDPTTARFVVYIEEEDAGCWKGWTESMARHLEAPGVFAKDYWRPLA